MHYIISVIFLVFAGVQYNDPDFFIWVPIYIGVALVALLFGRGYRNKRLVLALALAYFIGMCLYIPDVISWMKAGVPSITSSMKAESPFIEFVREFFGLAICLAVLTWYLRLTNKEAVKSKSVGSEHL